ncbi:TPA: Opacity protein opA54, partial [Neisseria gonorrhoeae]
MKIVLFSQLTLNFGAENESSPQKTFSSLLFPSAAQAAGEDHGRGPYVQADLAYAAERITHDYPEPTGA